MGSLTERVREETKKWRLGNSKTQSDVIKGTIFTYHGDEVTPLPLTHDNIYTLS